MSFSSDTGMAECLVIARKLRNGEAPSGPMEFTSFTHRPHKFEHAAAIASTITGAESIRNIEDGPYGGSLLMVGEERTGEMLSAPYDADGSSWSAVRLSDSSLAQAAYALSVSRLWLPGIAKAVKIQIEPLGRSRKDGTLPYRHQRTDPARTI